jgi:hypothetical protein
MSVLIFLVPRLLPDDIVDAIVSGDVTVSAEAKPELRQQRRLRDNAEE